MSEAKGEQESTETLSFRCDCERCRFMRGRKGRFAPQDDMSEVESNKNTSLALGERVSAGQERGQPQNDKYNFIHNHNMEKLKWKYLTLYRHTVSVFRR